MMEVTTTKMYTKEKFESHSRYLMEAYFKIQLEMPASKEKDIVLEKITESSMWLRLALELDMSHVEQPTLRVENMKITPRPEMPNA